MLGLFFRSLSLKDFARDLNRFPPSSFKLTQPLILEFLVACFTNIERHPCKKKKFQKAKKKTKNLEKEALNYNQKHCLKAPKVGILLCNSNKTNRQASHLRWQPPGVHSSWFRETWHLLTHNCAFLKCEFTTHTHGVSRIPMKH